MLLRTAFLCTLALALAAAPGVPATRSTAAAAAAFKYESVGLECTFEETCAWKWNATAPGGFRVVSVSEASFLGPQAPRVDASNNEDGHFLLLTGLEEPRLWIVNSPKYAATSEHCRLSVELHMANMQQGHFKVVVSGKNSSWWVSEKMGTNNRRWDKYKFPLGRVSQEFNIILEIETSNNKSSHGHLAMDNIELLDCFPKPPQNGCSAYRYHCDNETCVERDRVCDIKPDCPNGEDEDPELCDAGFPNTATHCSFENGWCGWNNTMNNSFNWVLHNGSSASNYTGPLFDHTYENATGTYMYLNMSQSSMFAEEAVAQSPIYYPPPPCHSNSSSPYFKSCKIRFYHHHFGRHNAALRLYLVELDKKQNPRELWRSYGVRSNKWYWKVVTLPNVTERYYFRFEARRGFGGLGDFGIDDVSMSPECFGKALPDNETIDIGYRYGHSYLSMKKSPAAMSHPDFANKPHYYLSTCGAKGRLGPRHTDCQQVYNNTSTVVSVLSKDPFFGVQKWIAPEGAYYTIIAKGASGGLGSEGNGSSLGATARLVVELHKGQSLYILVGQEGTGNTCWAGVTCPSISLDHRSPKTSMAHKIHKHIITGGGGGGGSFVFKLNENWTEAMPVVVAGGGGGLCEGVVDDGRQHGHGVRPERKPITGIEYGVTAADGGGGAGGGWRKGPQPQREITGSALLRGGQGGKPCNRNGDGTGGFGGGGSGCHTGGGGGGYSGGSSWSNESSVGEGGSSYIGSGWLGEITEGAHDGPGEVFIIPAIAGCKCDYKCVALDEYRHDVKCICPDNWELASDNHSCISTILTGDSSPSSLVILLLCVAPFIIISAVVASFFLYNRYQKKKITMPRGQMLNGPDLQLNRLREVSENVMTEYNPNYEFGGGTYTIQDLKDIPRDQLRLVKALGQGAFGEVYQGFFKHRVNDTVEMPVAVKTLPELSTNQAETDFLMEALIMSKFNHPNIVHFIGVCFDKHPRFIILELLSGGDLKTFLRESRPKPERPSPLTMKDLLQCSVDVAKGCKYMEDNRFIHRDIAARNCLLTTKGPGRVVKVADFGMARDIYRADYYRKGGKAILPIKWMPPEAFLDGIFTSKTDIWSFGVLLWEVMSLGYMPYTGCTNREVMELVTSGGRLEPPSNCPGPLYGIMTQCWHPNPDERPTFATILERLGYCMQDPDVVNSPLPVFIRPPSAERDTTIMRPPADENSCLQVQRAADYLVPLSGPTPDLPSSPSSSSVDKLLNNSDWETSFVLPESRSTQPLLEAETSSSGGSPGKTMAEDSLVSVDSKTSSNNNNNNNNNQQQNNLKGSLSLDPAGLIKQPLPYVNVNMTPSHANMSVPEAEGEQGRPFTIQGASSRHLMSEADISC